MTEQVNIHSVYVYTCIYICVYVYICMCIHTYTYAYICIHGYMYTHMYMCVYTHIYMCIYTHTHIHIWSTISLSAVTLFNLYNENIMRNTGLDELQAGIKIVGRNINNLRYAGDTTLMRKS